MRLLGVRGYYRDSMGAPGVNDLGIYEDALFVISPDALVAFNANTDPSVTRPRIATLVPGVYRYKLGVHGLSKPAAQRYRALVQAAPVTVARHGTGNDTGWFGINIHRGSLRSRLPMSRRGPPRRARHDLKRGVPDRPARAVAGVHRPG